MDIQHILVVSSKYKEMKEFIDRENLAQHFRFMPEEELTDADFDWADALAAFNLKHDYDYAKVKWVHSLGAGVDRFLHKKRWSKEVILTRTICSFGQRIGEYCLSYVLRDLQFHDKFELLQHQQSWQPLIPGLMSEQKVMIYGTGEIGQEVAKLFSILGSEVYGISLSGKQKEYFNKVYPIDNHVTHLTDMNYIINTLPLTEKTERLFNSAIFNHVSKVGYINVGRGATLDEDALLTALEQNQIKFAVLDVFTKEPLPQDHALWNHPNVFITPHISAVTTAEEGAACFLDTLKNIIDKKPLSNKVDIEKGF